MSCKQWMAGLALLAMITAGCGKPSGTGQTAGNADDSSTQAAGEAKSAEAIQREGPVAVLAQFLEAYRNGDDEKAMPWLSTIARQKMAEEHVNVTPEKSETSRFEIGGVEYLDVEGKSSPTCPAECSGARVETKLVDKDASGNLVSDRIVWVVRRESDRWGVAGMAAYVFPNEPPLLLNYENPSEMRKKEQWLREEMGRRDQQETPEVQVGKNSKDPIRR